jgi:hypothetical protein
MKNFAATSKEIIKSAEQTGKIVATPVHEGALSERALYIC